MMTCSDKREALCRDLITKNPAVAEVGIRAAMKASGFERQISYYRRSALAYSSEIQQKYLFD
jgi:hypothetical protein